LGASAEEPFARMVVLGSGDVAARAYRRRLGHVLTAKSATLMVSPHPLRAHPQELDQHDTREGAISVQYRMADELPARGSRCQG